MLGAIGLIGWHEICNVTVQEEFTLLRAKDRGCVHTAVATCDQHGARVLAVIGEAAIPAFILCIGGGFPALETLNEILGQWFCCVHDRLVRCVWAVLES